MSHHSNSVVHQLDEVERYTIIVPMLNGTYLMADYVHKNYYESV